MSSCETTTSPRLQRLARDSPQATTPSPAPAARMNAPVDSAIASPRGRSTIASTSNHPPTPTVASASSATRVAATHSVTGTPVVGAEPLRVVRSAACACPCVFFRADFVRRLAMAAGYSASKGRDPTAAVKAAFQLPTFNGRGHVYVVHRGELRSRCEHFQPVEGVGRGFSVSRGRHCPCQLPSVSVTSTL